MIAFLDSLPSAFKVMAVLWFIYSLKRVPSLNPKIKKWVESKEFFLNYHLDSIKRHDPIESFKRYTTLITRIFALIVFLGAIVGYFFPETYKFFFILGGIVFANVSLAIVACNPRFFADFLTKWHMAYLCLPPLLLCFGLNHPELRPSILSIKELTEGGAFFFPETYKDATYVCLYIYLHFGIIPAFLMSTICYSYAGIYVGISYLVKLFLKVSGMVFKKDGIEQYVTAILVTLGGMAVALA